MQDVTTAMLNQIGAILLPLLPDLQIPTDGLFEYNPTPPTLDMLPGENFQEQQAFGLVSDVTEWLLRARTNTPDNRGAQAIMLQLIDPRAATSVQAAVMSDRTLGGIVTDVLCSGATNYGIFPDPSGQGAFLGCTWTVRVTL